jgi:probable HAF family extracellular repeat protein
MKQSFHTIVLFTLVVSAFLFNSLQVSAQSGTITDLGNLGSVSRARGINDRGQIVGNSSLATGATHAFLWENGVITDLGTLGGANSQALGINDRGQIVGSSLTATGETHATLWSR